MNKFLFLLIFCAVGTQANSVLPASEAARVLEGVARAARETNYQGVYVQQREGGMETYRLIHVYDGGQEIERRESLDGRARELVRRGDVVSLYLPANQGRTAGSRGQAESMLPQLPAGAVAMLLPHYQLKRTSRERIAGLEADVYLLEPRDKYRYAQKIWVHGASGLLLKAALLGSHREAHEVFAFSQLQVGGVIDRKALQAVSTLPPINIQLRQALPTPHPELDWEVRELPAGFRLIKQTHRILAGEDRPAVQHLYSDGLICVSVFLEPVRQGLPMGFAHQGMTHLYGRAVQGQHLTVLGDVPPETIQKFSKAYRPLADGKDKK